LDAGGVWSGETPDSFVCQPGATTTRGDNVTSTRQLNVSFVRLAAALGAVVGLLGLALTGAPAAGASGTGALTGAVTGASLQISSHSADATAVAYTVNFVSPAALASGSTITLAAPSNTLWPPQAFDVYRVTDDATEIAVSGTVAGTGTSTLTYTTSSPVAAGDLVTVLVNDVTNPPASGAEAVEVSTSADPTAVHLGYSLVSEQAVTNAALTLGSLSEGAATTYSVKFVSPDRLSGSFSTVALSFPEGTQLPAPGDDYSCSSPLFSGSACGDASVTGTTVTLTTTTVSPGQVFSVVVAGVTNPDAASAETLALSTSSDPEPVTLHDTLVVAQQVTHPFLQLSSYAAGATGVRWSVGFTSPDRLTGGVSAITLSAPSGTVFPAAGSCDVGYTFVDPDNGTDTVCTSERITGSTAVVTVPTTTSPGDVLSVVIDGVTNPASGSLAVSTSADPAVVSLPLSSAHATVPTAVAVSSTSATATGGTYTATFALAEALTTSSTITLDGPSGTVFPSGTCVSGEYFVYDLITAASSSGCYTGAAGSTVTVSQDVSASAGDEFAIQIFDVTNTSATGSRTLHVRSSTGATTVSDGSATFRLTAPTKVGSLLLQLTSTSASASDVAYSLTFRAANGITPDWAGVTLQAPTGTAFENGNVESGLYSFVDDTTGLGSSGSGATSNSGATVVITPGTGNGFWAAPGDEVSVLVDGIANPTAAGNYDLTVSTGGDPVTTSSPYTLTAETPIKSPVLQLSSFSASATEVTYSASFRLTNGLVTSFSPITLVVPAGTGLPPGSGDSDGFAVYNDTTGLGMAALTQISGTTAVVTASVGAASGDEVTVLISSVTNAAAGNHNLLLSTGSDPVVHTLSFRLRAA
jgi:hypothetical protein